MPQLAAQADVPSDLSAFVTDLEATRRRIAPRKHPRRARTDWGLLRALLPHSPSLDAKRKEEEEKVQEEEKHVPLSAEWVELCDHVKGKTYFWNRRTRQSVWNPPPGIRVVWVATQNSEERSATGTRAPVSVVSTSLLFLQDGRRPGEGLGILSLHLGCHSFENPDDSSCSASASCVWSAGLAWFDSGYMYICQSFWFISWVFYAKVGLASEVGSPANLDVLQRAPFW